MIRSLVAFQMAVSIVAQDAAPQQRQVFHAVTEAVIVNVDVRDGPRRVLGLKPGDFELRDNGRVQVIADITAETIPIDVTLLLDVSGSLSPTQVEQLQRAFQQISKSLRPEDRCRTVTFGRRMFERAALAPAPCNVDWSMPYGNRADAVLLGDALATTALFDAVALTMVAEPQPDRRQLGLVLTDGLENASFFDAAAALDTARYTDLVLDFIIAAPASKRQSTFLRAQTALANATGGHLADLGPDRDIGKAFLGALEAFRSSYVLRYTPQGPVQKGWHDLTIKVIKPGAQHYTVSARRGYVRAD